MKPYAFEYHSRRLDILGAFDLATFGLGIGLIYDAGLIRGMLTLGPIYLGITIDCGDEDDR